MLQKFKIFNSAGTSSGTSQHQAESRNFGTSEISEPQNLGISVRAESRNLATSSRILEQA
jgi:hypothetical protein